MEFKKRKRPVGSTSSKPTPPPPELTDAEQELADQPEASISETLEELIALRKLKRQTGGIDLDRLNAGEVKKKRKVVAPSGDVVNDSGMLEGTHGGIKGKDRMRDDPDEDLDEAGAVGRKIVKSNNFTGQTNAVDVDKHMMQYIEAELRKRKPASESAAFDAEKEMQSLDPRDALYKVAEKYRFEKKAQEEGNVTLSASMLTAIPEVDLGIDTRLKNIEDTEKAKRLLFEQKQAKAAEEEEFATDRFYKARRPQESDGDALARARKEAELSKLQAQVAPKKELLGQGRREMATDDQVMDRFKKRQQNHKR